LVKNGMLISWNYLPRFGSEKKFRLSGRESLTFDI